MKKIMSSNENGLTIIELIIAISLLGIVMALGYMYVNFGMSSFDRGEEKTIVQQSARFAAGFVTTELRFANQVEINPTDTIGTSGYKYIYQYDGSVMMVDEQGETLILADGPADDTVYSFHIFCAETDSMTIPDKYHQYIPVEFPADLVVFIIEGGDDFYTLATSVQALNLSIYENKILANEGPGNVVKYYKPSE